MYEDEEIERLILERDNSPIGIATLTQTLITNANSEVVKKTISTMESILYNFKKHTQI